MAIGPDKVRLQTVIDRKLADRIHSLAQRMEVSDSAMVYMLLEAVVANESWIINAVTTEFAKKVGRALGLSGTDRDRFVEAQTENELVDGNVTDKP